MAQRDAFLLPPDALLAGVQKMSVDAESAYSLRQGQAIWRSKQTLGSTVRLYDEKERFIGIGEVSEDGKIAPKRLVVLQYSEIP